MPSGVPLSEMRAEVRRRGNFETTNQAQSFATDSEIDALINSYLAEFYDELIAANGPAYFRATPQTYGTIGGASSYALPADFYRLISVDITWGQNIVRSARPFNEAERNRFKWYPGWNYTTPIYFQIQGSLQDGSGSAQPRIVFQPIPSGSTSITINYVPIFSPLDAGADDAIDSINRWSDFAVWSAVAALKHKDEADASFALGEAEKIRQRVRALADTREDDEPPRVQRVTKRWAWEDG